MASAGHNFCGEYRIAVVGFLVSGSGAGRRRLHRAAHLQRERRKERPAGRALVQRRALRLASLALDSDRAGGGGSLSAPGTSRNRIHAGGQPARAAGAARHCDCRIHGGVHVHDRNPAELGRFLSGVGFLSPLHQARRRRQTLRADLASGDRAAGDRIGRNFRSAV